MALVTFPRRFSVHLVSLDPTQGAEMRKTLGTAVFSGMLGVTLFGIFLTPVFFFVIEGFVESPVFSSRPMRLLRLVLIYLLMIATLGIPLLLMRLGGKPASRAS